MRLGRTASLLVALALFTSAATAHADSEWVLWVKKDYDAALAGRWRLIQAYATQQDCITALGETFTEASNGQTMSERDTTRGSFMLTYGGVAALSAMCLPDTVDPRGAKTGTR